MSIRQPSSHKTVFNFLKQLRREIDVDIQTTVEILPNSRCGRYGIEKVTASLRDRS